MRASLYTLNLFLTLMCPTFRLRRSISIYHRISNIIHIQSSPVEGVGCCRLGISSHCLVFAIGFLFSLILVVFLVICLLRFPFVFSSSTFGTYVFSSSLFLLLITLQCMFPFMQFLVSLSALNRKKKFDFALYHNILYSPIENVPVFQFLFPSTDIVHSCYEIYSYNVMLICLFFLVKLTCILRCYLLGVLL